MGNEQIILIGGGGHAKVVFDAMVCAGLAACGFVDDDPQALIFKLDGCPEYLGSIASAANHDGVMLIAIGDVPVRRRLINTIGPFDYARAVVHPRAIVAKSSMLGIGVFVGPGAIVNADARIGDHAIINSGAIVEHDCAVGINTHIAPGAKLGGGAKVGDDTLIGIGATVLPGIRIGNACVVGAGAVVTCDVGDGETVVGVPARVVGVCVE